MDCQVQNIWQNVTYASTIAQQSPEITLGLDWSVLYARIECELCRSQRSETVLGFVWTFTRNGMGVPTHQYSDKSPFSQVEQSYGLVTDRRLSVGSTLEPGDKACHFLIVLCKNL